MTATILYMDAGDNSMPLSAPPQATHGEVLAAQKAALEAQQTAEKAQIKAIALQTDTQEHCGADRFVDEANAAATRLKEACEEVSAIEEKLIKHALK